MCNHGIRQQPGEIEFTFILDRILAARAQVTVYAPTETAARAFVERAIAEGRIDRWNVIKMFLPPDWKEVDLGYDLVRVTTPEVAKHAAAVQDSTS